MPYSAYFSTADNVIAALTPVAAQCTDPILIGQYTGFAAVSAVTMYELAIKLVFRQFAERKHLVFGHFVGTAFDRINGRIGLRPLREQHVSMFGSKYLAKFDRLLSEVETRELRANGVSIKSSYGNLITWRHEFAHLGRVPTNATFSEVQRSYETGKAVITCLAQALVR